MKRYILANDESWRLENPLYQEKTLGGVYFYSSPGIYVGDSIERNLYDRLPNYAKASVLQLNGTGVSISGWFMTKYGVIYMNHEKGDFFGEVRDHRADFVNANGYNGNVDDDVVADWST